MSIRDEQKGQVPVGLLLLKNGANIDEPGLVAELVQKVRDAVGPIANFKRALRSAACPRPAQVRYCVR